MNLRSLTRALPAVALAALTLSPLHHPAPTVTTAQRASVQAPTTAQGYTDMWTQQVPTTLWGAADVGISVPLYGRAVWLFGDTLSSVNGFVNSTAITQTGGLLHVSHAGQQLLPAGGADPADPTRHIVYWIERGVREGGTDHGLIVTAAPMSIGASGVWDFRRANVLSRQAELTVNTAGDVTFTRWLWYVTAPTPDNTFWTLGLHHFAYSKQVHPELTLAGGAHLVTYAQNWDDPAGFRRTPSGAIDYNAYRLIFTANGVIPASYYYGS